jgi:hypothetical protein
MGSSVSIMQVRNVFDGHECCKTPAVCFRVDVVRMQHPATKEVPAKHAWLLHGSMADLPLVAVHAKRTTGTLTGNLTH